MACPTDSDPRASAARLDVLAEALVMARGAGCGAATERAHQRAQRVATGALLDFTGRLAFDEPLPDALAAAILEADSPTTARRALGDLLTAARREAAAALTGPRPVLAARKWRSPICAERLVAALGGACDDDHVIVAGVPGLFTDQSVVLASHCGASADLPRLAQTTLVLWAEGRRAGGHHQQVERAWQTAQLVAGNSPEAVAA